ncbi:hypothetical protein WJX75_004955 [Coccomyxa subellipsoidea]|uniref:Transmembrane 9 superfamily member n=1 Tax=Coccomyxa subellipsoidea TaxID=248742 RepID=A0ABR2YKV9_9CHLO
MGAGMMRAAILLFFVSCSFAYYLPGTYPQEFFLGQTLQAEANSLTSSETELPFNYYSLPFCKPPEGVKKSINTINPGTILMGTRIENSPYNFSMLVEEKTKLACQPEGFYGPLTEREVVDLREKIDQHYRARLILDNLPITTYDLEENPESIRPGYEIGISVDGKYYLNNHLMFKILVHKTNGQYTRARKNMAELEAAAVVEGGSRRRQLLAPRALLRDTPAGVNPPVATTLGEVAGSVVGGDADEPMYMVVGFEVMACSIARKAGEKPKDISCIDTLEGKPPAPQEITKDAKLVYTYDVYWELSDISWASRWDAYLRMPGGRVHWFSILNSLMVVVVMSSIVAMIMMRTIRRDLQRYEGLLGESSAKDDVEESGWKMVSGDVFRSPKSAMLLCVQLGSGVQIILSSFITLFFAALGFLSPASRGALLTAMLVMYLLLALGAGFASVWLWGLIQRSYDGWSGVAWRVASYFPGITLATLSCLNILLVHTGSSGAIPLTAFFSLISLWFIISIPLCFSGGIIATKQEIKAYPTRTNQIPRHIPPPHWASHPAVLFMAAGLLPFGTIFVELYFAMTSIWQGYFYYIFGFCFVVGMLTVLITIEVAIVCTYVQLCAEDYLWWWRSFHRGGSVALYIGIYSIGFLVNTLHSLSGLVSVMLYLSYMTLVLWGIYLAMGTVGFFASLLFTYKIFSAVKAD